MPETSEVLKEPTPITTRRHENYENWYSNNVHYQQSEWDLKMVFGQLDWTGQNYEVEQHTAITMAWLQAKLMLYFLSVQVGVYEMTHGKITIPINAMPPEPQPPTEEQAQDPVVTEMYHYMKKKWEQFSTEQSV
jgi:hypothetical protein